MMSEARGQLTMSWAGTLVVRVRSQWSTGAGRVAGKGWSAGLVEGLYTYLVFGKARSARNSVIFGWFWGGWCGLLVRIFGLFRGGIWIFAHRLGRGGLGWGRFVRAIGG